MIAAAALVLAAGAVLASPLPAARPDHPAAAAQLLCRDPRLQGAARPDLVDVKWLACGIDDPVRVTAVEGIALTPPVLVGCQTARRLADWLTGVVQPAARADLQAGLAGVQVMGSYACRTRNNVAGGRRSEHARGRAVDIGGFRLTDGKAVTVARHWGRGPEGAFLRRVWHKACGAFTTVLGPEADRHHWNHLHLDTSPRHSAPYCR